jgi:hypothetical protein
MCKTPASYFVFFVSHFSKKLITKMALSHYTLDSLSPKDPPASGGGAGGGPVVRIRVQPHRVSKDKQSILDYDSNDDFVDADDFDDSDTPTPGQASSQFSLVSGGQHGM